MTKKERGGRPNQRLRTRKDLLEAGARLLQKGHSPTLEEVAEEALVSRATAYRYFSSVEALLVEAAVDVSVPGASDIFEQQPTDDPAARLVQVDQAIHDFVLENELQLRLVLAHTIEQGAKKNEVPVRQDRRTPLIEAALAPAGKRFKQSQLNHLKAAAAMIIGTEGMLVARDVLQLDDRKARRVKRWAIQALVDSALRQSKNT